MKSSAFTLVEVLVVLVITAVIAAAASLTVAASGAGKQVQEVTASLVAYDGLMRANARRFGRPRQLVFCAQSGTVQYLAQDAQAEQAGRLNLPTGYLVEKIILPDQIVLSGRVGIPCSELGVTISYALVVSGPLGQRQGLEVAGLTGQALDVDDENMLQDILQELSPKSDDAR